jgi:hypothetical protein
MMSLARSFKIQNGMNFSLNHSEHVNYPKQGTMVKPCILVVAGVEGFAPCKDNLHPFHSHYANLEAVV